MSHDFAPMDTSPLLSHIRSSSLHMSESMNRENGYSPFPLNHGTDEPPPIEINMAIPIPEAYLADAEKMTFMGTPKAQNLYSLISFTFLMVHRRYVLRAKPKKKDTIVTEPVNDGTSGAPATEVNGPLNPVLPEAARANEALGEEVARYDEENTSSNEEYSSDQEVPNPDEMAAVTDVHLPPVQPPGDAAAQEKEKDKIDANYVMNFIYKGATFRKVRFFMEKVIYGQGISAGFILWVTWYDRSVFSSIFLSLLGYNSVFHANPSNMEKLMQKGSTMEKASMKIFSPVQYVDCLRNCSSIVLPDRILNSEDLVDFNSPYNLKNFFSVDNAKLIFPERSPSDNSILHWNWRVPPGTLFGRSPHKFYYPELIREVSPKEVDSPNTLRGFAPYLCDVACQILTSENTLPRLTRVGANGQVEERPYTKAEIAEQYGVMNDIRRAAIDNIISMLSNKLMSGAKEFCDPLRIKYDYFFHVAHTIKQKKKTLTKEEELHDIFRSMYGDLYLNLVDDGVNMNCSKAQREIFANYTHMKLPQKYDPLMYEQRSDLPPMADVLFQFCENFQDCLRIHKGDRFTLLLYFFLTGLPIDSLENEDLQNVAAMGPQQKGKSTGAQLASLIMTPERIYTLNNITNNALHVLGNWNGYVVVCDEADVAKLLGIDINSKTNSNVQSNMTTLCNDFKTIFVNGGLLVIVYYNTGDKENRSTSVCLFQANASFWFMQNGQLRTIMASPLASRLFFMRYTDEGKSLLDGDELLNMDGKVSKNAKDFTSAFGKTFIEFCQFIDRLTFIYNHFVMMGAFTPIDTDLILATLNSMNGMLRKAGFTAYDDRLKQRTITIIRRFTVWLCITTFFGTEIGRVYVERAKKLTLDFDVLIALDKFIKANSPNPIAIAFVMSVFSGENTKDRISVIHRLLKKYYKIHHEQFKHNDLHQDADYMMVPCTHKSDLLSALIDIADVPLQPEDLDNYFFELTKYTMKDPKGNTIRALRYTQGPTHRLTMEMNVHFLNMDQTSNIRTTYLELLRNCLNLQGTLPTTVLTAFPFEHTHHGKLVRLGGVLHPVYLGNGRNVLKYLVPSTSLQRSKQQFIEHIYTDDFGYKKDPNLHYTLAVRRQFNQQLNISTCVIPHDIVALPSYPMHFANEICAKVDMANTKRSYTTMCMHLVPYYCAKIDTVMRDDEMERDRAATELKECLGLDYIPSNIIEAYCLLLESYANWNRHLYLYWCTYIYKWRWLHCVSKNPVMHEKATYYELMLHQISIESTTRDALLDFNRIKHLRKMMIEFHPDIINKIGATFEERLSEAVNLLLIRQSFPVLHTYANAKSIRPSNAIIDRTRGPESASFMVLLDRAQATINHHIEEGHFKVMSKDNKFDTKSYHPTMNALLQYDARHDTDPLVIVLRTKDLFRANIQNEYPTVAIEQRRAIQEYHDALLQWHKVMYFFSLYCEYMMEAVMFLVFEDDFAVNIMCDKIKCIHEAYERLQPLVLFDLLKKKSAALMEMVRTYCYNSTVINTHKLIDMGSTGDCMSYIFHEIGDVIYMHYYPIYDKYLAPMVQAGELYLNDPVVINEVKAIVFEPRIEGSEEDIFRSVYDISAITKDRWPSRERIFEKNIKANEQVVSLASSVNHIKKGQKRSASTALGTFDERMIFQKKK